MLKYKQQKRKLAGVVTVAATCLLLEEEYHQEKSVRKHRIWRKEWLGRRKLNGFCASLLLELKAEEPELYRNVLRMTAEQFDQLLTLVKPFIEKKNTNMRESIPASDRLVLTLRYLATGESFKSLQYLFRISQPAISRIIPEVLDSIYNVLVADFMKIPQTAEEWNALSHRFNEKWNFPNCIGAVDGKHVVMISPPHSGSTFYNYKGTYSIVLLGIADADYNLIYIDVGRNGRCSDGGVFSRCSFGQALASDNLNLPAPKALPGRDMEVPYVLVADDAFAMSKNLMKPYAQRGLTMIQRIFNYRLSRARHLIENVFGIMAARFRVLRTPINLDAQKTAKVVLACSVLHNFLMKTNKAHYAPYLSFDQYDAEGNLTTPGEWREIPLTATMLPLEPQRGSTDAKEIQKELSFYFVEEGEVSWQNKCI